MKKDTLDAAILFKEGLLKLKEYLSEAVDELEALPTQSCKEAEELIETIARLTKLIDESEESLRALDAAVAEEMELELSISKKSGVISAALKEAYEWKVAMEALSRAGKNKNLHGHVHEILFRDSQNINIPNALKGIKAVLAKSTTSVRDDVLLMKAGKIIKRVQLKDTSKSIGNTIKEVSAGKYKGTNLMGTKETAKAFNAATKTSQKMKSSGVSSSDTTRIATKALGGKITKDVILSSAKSAGVVGAAVGAGVEVLCSAEDFLDGKINGEEFACRVAKEAVGGGLAGAAGGATAAVITTVVAASTTVACAPLLAGIAGATIVGSTVKSVWDWLCGD